MVALLNITLAIAIAAQPPGVVIAHYPATSGMYVGSPSIAILPNGEYIASHDGFGPQHEFGRTYLFQSRDAGDSWQPLEPVDGQGSSTLFVHKKALYLMGLGSQSVLIRRSVDHGRTWTVPNDKNTGQILSGVVYHTAPTPLLVHDGRIWRAMEDGMGPGKWAENFRSFMMSAPLDADLLRADSWTCTNPLGGQRSWLSGEFDGWLEGNAVATPEGDVVNVLRVHYYSYEGTKSAIIRISRDGKKASFDPATGFIDLPGAAKKFTIRHDPSSKKYWSLTNYVPERHRHGGQLHPGGNPESTRNTLALVCSSDLKDWSIRSIVLYHPDTAKHGFQYVDWQFEGNDIVAVSRTAFDDDADGAHDMHDANYLTFHRIKDFREQQSNAMQE